MKEASLVVWTAVIAFLGGGFGTFVYLIIAHRSKQARLEKEKATGSTIG